MIDYPHDDIPTMGIFLFIYFFLFMCRNFFRFCKQLKTCIIVDIVIFCATHMVHTYGTVRTSESWAVNRHTLWCTSTVSIFLQCKLVSGWGLRKCGLAQACCLERTVFLHFFYFYTWSSCFLFAVNDGTELYLVCCILSRWKFIWGEDWSW